MALRSYVAFAAVIASILFAAEVGVGLQHCACHVLVLQAELSLHSAGELMPIARYSACESHLTQCTCRKNQYRQHAE